MFFWHSFLHLWPKSTQNAHKGKKEGTVTQRGNTVLTEKGKEPGNVPDQQDPVAGRGAEGGDSAVREEHTRGHEI